MRMTGPDDEEEELRRDLSKSAGDGTYKGPVTRTSSVQLKDGANPRCLEGRSEEQLGRGKHGDCSFRA